MIYLVTQSVAALKDFPTLLGLLSLAWNAMVGTLRITPRIQKEYFQTNNIAKDHHECPLKIFTNKRMQPIEIMQTCHQMVLFGSVNYWFVEIFTNSVEAAS